MVQSGTLYEMQLDQLSKRQARMERLAESRRDAQPQNAIKEPEASGDVSELLEPPKPPSSSKSVKLAAQTPQPPK